MFESGNQILQGLAAGSWRAPLGKNFAGELSATTGVNKYDEYPGYGHLLARARIHVAGSRSGGWLSGASGQSWISSSSATPYQLELGGWSVYQSVVIGATATRTWFADTAYADIVGLARFTDARLEITGTLGLRTWSDGGGEGVYGEINAQIPIWKRFAGIASGGRYPSDPVRGVIPANYVSVGMRINAQSGGSRLTGALTRDSYRTDPPRAGEARLQIKSSTDDLRVIQVHAPGAESVVVTGDFTDWQPVPLLHVENGRWEIVWRVTPGVHRVNIRLNDGAWLVPKGLRSEEDEFGGAVGILVVW